ncbi:MAG: tyrosine-type recombinase/integrase [Rubripirellula sp.]
MFVDSLPDQCGVEEAFSGPVLADYLAAIKSCQFASGTKRNRIASVSQFALWAFERDYIESIPRLIAAKKFKVEVAATEVSVYSDDEVVEILAGAKDRERLYILLALNCGFTQQDIADLRPDEFDPDAGAITRKRSKTKGHDAVPEVTRLLWTETKKFLREHASNDDERLLLNTTGRPLVEVREDAGKVKRTDAIAKAMARLRKRLGRRDPISFKVFRATAASKLGEHESYRAYAQHFLGHAPSNVADSHYVKPSQEQFDKAIRWLRKQWDYQRVDLSNRTGFLRGNPTHAN